MKKLIRKYVKDIKARTALFLRIGLAVNIIYAAYNLLTGALYRSVWLGGVAVYYIMLCLIKFFLLRRGFKGDNSKKYRNMLMCGIMLLMLNTTMTILIGEMIINNTSHLYSGAVIYPAAVYTLFRISAAAVDTFRLKKLDSPTLYTAKALSLSVALMSVFSFQTALLDRVGVEEGLRQTLNIITGTASAAGVLMIAAGVIIKAKNKM